MMMNSLGLVLIVEALGFLALVICGIWLTSMMNANVDNTATPDQKKMMRDLALTIAIISTVWVVVIAGTIYWVWGTVRNDYFIAFQMFALFTSLFGAIFAWWAFTNHEASVVDAGDSWFWVIFLILDIMFFIAAIGAFRYAYCLFTTCGDSPIESAIDGARMKYGGDMKKKHYGSGDCSLNKKIRRHAEIAVKDKDGALLAAEYKDLDCGVPECGPYVVFYDANGEQATCAFGLGQSEPVKQAVKVFGGYLRSNNCVPETGVNPVKSIDEWYAPCVGGCPPSSRIPGSIKPGSVIPGSIEPSTTTVSVNGNPVPEAPPK